MFTVPEEEALASEFTVTNEWLEVTWVARFPALVLRRRAFPGFQEIRVPPFVSQRSVRVLPLSQTEIEAIGQDLRRDANRLRLASLREDFGVEVIVTAESRRAIEDAVIGTCRDALADEMMRAGRETEVDPGEDALGCGVTISSACDPAYAGGAVVGERRTGRISAACLTELALGRGWPTGGEVFTDEAEARAEALLLRHLDAEQADDYRNMGYFRVYSTQKFIYYIWVRRSINVERADGRRFCLEMPGCPIADQLLAQKLMIEADEGDFIAKAREWPPRGGTLRADADALDWGYYMNAVVRQGSFISTVPT